MLQRMQYFADGVHPPRRVTEGLICIAPPSYDTPKPNSLDEMWERTNCEKRRKGGNGASEGIRTLDTHVGNVMLYQAELRSLPDRFGETTRIQRQCKLFCF